MSEIVQRLLYAHIGVTPRTIQKRIKAMEELGLMEREERRHTKYGSVTNLYSFNGLIKAVAPFAEEKLAEKAEDQAAERSRIKSKKPKLVVDNK
jgi:DNA-binding HxlR family transcriptional regulator